LDEFFSLHMKPGYWFRCFIILLFVPGIIFFRGKDGIWEKTVTQE